MGPVVRVIVEGVRAVSVVSGGNTKSVCEGVETTECDVLCFGVNGTLRVLRRCRGGGAGFRDSVRVRRREGIAGATGSAMSVTGEDGTGGRMPMGGGRRLPLSFDTGGLEGRSNEAREAEAGGGGKLNDIFHAGADGGGRSST